MDLGERGVSCSDHGDWAIGYGCAACVLYPGEVASTTQWFQGLEDIGPSFVASSFHVDEEVKGLGAIAIEDTVNCRIWNKRRGWVLFVQNVEERIDVKGVKGARGCEG